MRKYLVAGVGHPAGQPHGDDDRADDRPGCGGLPLPRCCQVCQSSISLSTLVSMLVHV